MSHQKKDLFFTEIGLLLNLIRSISSAIIKETGENFVEEDDFNNVRYMRNTPVSRMKERLKQLESEIAYFFTANGARKATDSVFDSQPILQKFISACKALSNEYFTLKSGVKEKIAFEQDGPVNLDAGIYKLTRQRTAVVN